MRVLLLGGTGLIGSQVIELKPKNVHLTVIGRRPIVHPNVDEQIITDFSEAPQITQEFDVLIIAFGTIIAKAGTKENFRAIDVGIPTRVLKSISKSSVKQVHLVSSIGVNEKARGFYLKCKYELEQIILKEQFQSTVIYRPSMLTGARKEFRWKEELGLFISKPFFYILPSLTLPYKPVKDTTLAQTIWNNCQKNKPGTKIIESKEIQETITI